MQLFSWILLFVSLCSCYCSRCTKAWFGNLTCRGIFKRYVGTDISSTAGAGSILEQCKHLHDCEGCDYCTCWPFWHDYWHVYNYPGASYRRYLILCYPISLLYAFFTSSWLFSVLYITFDQLAFNQSHPSRQRYTLYTQSLFPSLWLEHRVNVPVFFFRLIHFFVCMCVLTSCTLQDWFAADAGRFTIAFFFFFFFLVSGLEAGLKGALKHMCVSLLCWSAICEASRKFYVQRTHKYKNDLASICIRERKEAVAYYGHDILVGRSQLPVSAILLKGRNLSTHCHCDMSTAWSLLTCNNSSRYP